MPERERLLTPIEVGKLMRVHHKTVIVWAHQGRIRFIRTPGGRMRFWELDVEALLAGQPMPRRDRNGIVIPDDTPTEEPNG